MDENKKKSVEKQLKQVEQNLNQSAFNLQPAQYYVELAKNLKKPQQFFGSLWSHGELSMLVGDTGVGKSFLALFIGDSITSKKTTFLGLPIEPANSPVIYCDFELSDVQFGRRFANYNFSTNLIRCTFNYESNADSIIDEIEKMLEENCAKIIIIDNISALALRPTQDTDVALTLMRKLKSLTRNGYSCLVLAHTPKFAKISSLQIEHMAGSKVLANFSDSIFFIHRSNTNFATRFIKQVKARNTEQMEDVVVFRFDEDNGKIYFNFIGFDDEHNHLNANDTGDTFDLNQAKKLQSEGKSVREIAKIMGCSKSKVNRRLNNK